MNVARKWTPIWVALAALPPFLPALTAPFLEWDDALNLTANEHWRGFSLANVRWMLTTTHGGPYQPLSWLSYAFDYTLWGANPAAMRATNFLLHAATAGLLYLVIDALIVHAAPETAKRERALAAAFAALIWAVHPLRVESVVWLTERRDVLSGFFYALTLFLYIREPRRPLLPLFAYCLAVLSKASVITLPLTLLLLDRWPLRRRTFADKIPYFAVSLAAGIAGLAGQYDTGVLRGTEVGLGERVSFLLYSTWWYAGKTIWPLGLSPYHHIPEGFGLETPAVWLGALALLAAAGLAWHARRRAPVVPAAILQYALALAPMAGLVNFGHHLVAERYSYLPGMALAGLAGAGLLAARHRVPRAAMVVSAALLLGAGAMTARGAVYWSGTESLWRRAIAVDPESTLPRVNLATYYRRAGRAADALAEERAAVAIDPRLAKLWNNLGVEALGRKDYLEAERMVRAAIAAEPELATAHYNLATALNGTGRHGEALAELEEAARLDFDNPHILNSLGVALSFAGEHARAEVALGRAAELDSDWAAPRYNRGNALTALGRTLEALQCFEEAARLEPRFAQAWINSGNLLAKMGRLREAEQRYRKALAADPDSAAAKSNLAEVRRVLGER